MGTILTPEEYATDIAYTIKRKHKCSVLLLKFGDFKYKDSIAMLFLLIAFFSLESDCKNTNNYPIRKKYFHHVADNEKSKGNNS